MKLILKNIGKVQNATVEINGITVIAGENDTGKSTVGKALFSVFNSFYNIDEKITEEKRGSIENQLQVMFREAPLNDFFYLDSSELVKEILDFDKKRESEEKLQKDVFDAILAYDDRISKNISEDRIKAATESIIKVLLVPDADIIKSILQKNMDAEFQGQVGNVFYKDESSIRLGIRNEEVKIRISKNRIIDMSSFIKLGTEIIYMDDPLVLDELSGGSVRMWIGTPRYPDHRAHLKECLKISSSNLNVVDEIVANEKFDQIYQKISLVCEGDVVRGKSTSIGYQIGDQRLNVRNMSTGLKTFAILKSLLTNSYIKTNGTIILDEPEIHLHPEWQLLFAELIVLLHKEFGLHILLNTHSPYFLNAIEVYAAKYQVSDKCKYYLTENVDKVSQIEDVTDNIEKIYSKLARPLQVLENERYRYEGV